MSKAEKNEQPKQAIFRNKIFTDIVSRKILQMKFVALKTTLFSNA